MKMRAKRHLSQTFLVKREILERIAESAQITPDDIILEIGSGPGNLTELLCRKAKFVYAVEIDKELCSIAQQKLSNYYNFKIINKDFLKLDFNSAIRNPQSAIKVIANLPYHITTPIIFRLLEHRRFFSGIYITVQKEVAERIVAKPGGKDYGILTCSVSFYARPEILFIINKSAFKPQPKVDSAFLRLEVLDRPSVSVKDGELFLNLIKSAFGQRRKTILNALSNAKALKLSRAMISEALELSEIDPKSRAETSSLQKFAQLSNALYRG